MFFPGALYTLKPRDQQVTWLEPWIQSIELTQNAQFLEVILEVPPERVLVLQSAVAQAETAGAISCVDVWIDLVNPALAGVRSRLTAFFSGVAPTAGLTRAALWSGSVLIQSRWVIRARTQFTVAGAANLIRLSCQGMLIPNGNIARV